MVAHYLVGGLSAAILLASIFRLQDWKSILTEVKLGLMERWPIGLRKLSNRPNIYTTFTPSNFFSTTPFIASNTDEKNSFYVTGAPYNTEEREQIDDYHWAE